MKVYEIADLIEQSVPERLAYKWDNVGLLCGDKNKDIKKVFLTLDTNINTVKEAINKKCDMIISHHPILLGGIKRIDYDTASGQMIKLIIENNIPVFAAHTNMDTAKGGINDTLAEIFKLSDIKILEQHTDDISAGLGRYGCLKEEMSLKDFSIMVKDVLKTPVRVGGDMDKKIKTIAVASGSCSEIIPLANEKGCDAIITADLKYHTMIDATELGIAVIDAGHYPTEIIVMDIFENILKNTGLEFVKSENKDIFNFI